MSDTNDILRQIAADVALIRAYLTSTKPAHEEMPAWLRNTLFSDPVGGRHYALASESNFEMYAHKVALYRHLLQHRL